MYLWVVSKGKHAGDGIDLLHAALVVEVLLSIRLEPIFVVVKVDQMASPQLGHVLEEVLHVEADLATAPIAAPGTVKGESRTTRRECYSRCYGSSYLFLVQSLPPPFMPSHDQWL